MECEIDFASFRRYTFHKAKQMKFAMHGGRSVEDDGEVYSDSADRPFRDAAVLFFLPVQKHTLRSFCLGSKWKPARGEGMCAVLCLMQLCVLAFTWSGWTSVLPVAANIASTIAGYTDNPRKIRAAAMFVNSPLWMLYNVLSGSLAGILDEIVTEISLIVSIVRFGWKALDRVEE